MIIILIMISTLSTKTYVAISLIVKSIRFDGTFPFLKNDFTLGFSLAPDCFGIYDCYHLLNPLSLPYFGNHACNDLFQT